MFTHPSEFVTFKISPHLPGVELSSAYLSLFHFMRSFSPAFHATPHQSLQARRAARAKVLLAQGTLPSDTAVAVGLTGHASAPPPRRTC